MYVGAQLEMFGSSANGFGSRNSDLDICLILPGHDKVRCIKCACEAGEFKLQYIYSHGI